MKSKALLPLIVLAIFLLVSIKGVRAICDINITWSSNTTYTMTQNNTYYCLNQSWVIMGTTAIQFANPIQNTTLDCMSNGIRGNGAQYGVYLTGGGIRNNTIKNCNVTDFSDSFYLYNSVRETNLINNSADESTMGFEVYIAYNTTFINNTAKGNSNYGFLSYASDNTTFVNNFASGNSYNFYISGGIGNAISGGSSVAGISGEYYLSGVQNRVTFRDTNFTDSRKIYFADTNGWFNYNNETNGNIWLKTKISTAFLTLIRKLNSWSKSIMRWNDSADLATTATYNMSGLLANREYKIYNGTQNIYNLTSNSNGEISFTIYLPASNERDIKVQYENCNIAIKSLPYDISQNNTQYCLDSDFNNVDPGSGNGVIEFLNNLENTTLDCLNYNLNGTRANDRYGIYTNYVDRGVLNLTIKNCNISNFDTGVYARYVNYSKIINSSFINNSDTGIYTYVNGYVNVTNNTFRGNVYKDVHLYSSGAGFIIENNSMFGGTSDDNIYLEGASQNSTIKGNVITTSSSHSSIYASGQYTKFNIIVNNTLDSIMFYDARNNTIENNTVKTITLSYASTAFGAASNTLINNLIRDGEGIAIIASFYNNLIDNKLYNTTNGIHIDSSGVSYSNYNNITGGSLYDNTFDYRIDSYSSAGWANYFRNTNFTAPRVIRFDGSKSWFTYNNQTDGNIWLKTNVSAAATITRKLINWNQTLMQWNDTNSSGTGISARYNITGLNANKYYLIYNNSELAYTFQTDSSGLLPDFIIYLGSEHEIKVQQDPAPQYFNNQTNNSVAGNPTLFSINWTDHVALSGYVFSFDNGTGTFENDSWAQMTGVGNWSNVTKTLNSTVGSIIRWKAYANDSSDSWNATDVFIFSSKAIDGSACNASEECLSSYCIHSVCRSSSYYCGDSYCDSGESCSSCSSDCGSCQTSGSYSSQTTVTTGKVTKTYSYILPFTPRIITAADLNASGTHLTEIYISVQNKVTNVEITIEKLPKLPAEVTPGAPEKVYQYISIGESNLDDGNIETARMKFTVDKKWITNNTIDVNTITMHRFSNNSWNKLATNKTGEDANYIYYEAMSPGFSYFAISGEVENQNCPYDCCISEVPYFDKSCPSGYRCENNTCALITTPCTEKWNCSDWGDCLNSIQSRHCVDENNCGTVAGKPSESSSCETAVTFPTERIVITLLFGTITFALIFKVWLNNKKENTNPESEKI